ncbi:Secreted effector protein pipB2 [Posidoniimonas polymericola]|uniref:Secreted effector protein pipB2 n=1 Tax=Posidoniimonas polymericola TaxID=2528002 RepID=A0A5C5XS05_9BACT|nr:pentapeptide repeat-containing protein [Posidoniimonas polymericola]TWT65429.1 Secreted effector protein pipB2 [Posidoniimonas polymericola]
MPRFGRPPQPLHVPLALRGADAIAEHRRQFPDQPLQLRCADLSGAILAGADLSGADLRGATLDGARLDGARLHNARLREASLRDCVLTGAKGLIAGQLAGTDLTGAELPENISIERLEEAARCGDTADFARAIFMWMVGGCAFVWLMLISTTQLQLLTNDGVVSLPVFDVDAPSELFFLLGPFLVIGVYCYLHVYLQRIWDVLGRLPAVFPDGEPIDRKTHGWMVLGLVRWQWRQLRDRPRMFVSQTLLSVLLAWGLGPITVYSVWRQCAIRHDMPQSMVQAVACAAIAYVAVGSVLAARGAFTLRRNRLAHAGQWVIALIVLLGMRELTHRTFEGRTDLSWLNAKVVHFHPTDRTPKWGRTKRELQNEYQDGAPFYSLNFRGERDPGFTPAFDARLVDLGKRWREAYAEFSGPLLREARLEGCCFKHSDLSSADLSGSRWKNAHLEEVDLTQANLQLADFEAARFADVHFIGASAQGANFTDVTCRGLVAMGAEFHDAIFLRFRMDDEAPPADLRKAVFDDAVMNFCVLEKARLQGASLRKAQLHEARLAHADLSGADLRGADLSGADLRGASLKGARLEGANLGGAWFGQTTLAYRHLRSTLTTLLDDADLSGATGLTNEMIAAAMYNDATRWDNRPPTMQVAQNEQKRTPAGYAAPRVAQNVAPSAGPSYRLFDAPEVDGHEPPPQATLGTPSLMEQMTLESPPPADESGELSFPTTGLPEIKLSPVEAATDWPSEPWPE